MSFGVAMALPCHAAGGGGVVVPITTYPNGFRYRLHRLIPAAVHQMPTGSAGWFQYHRTSNSLKSVANGGHVQNGTFLDHRFEAGSTVIPHELEIYDPTTGAILAWLFLSGFRDGIDYELFHYYGNAAMTATQSNPGLTWTGFAQSNKLSTGADLSGNSQHFILDSVAGATLLFRAGAGDFS